MGLLLVVDIVVTWGGCTPVVRDRKSSRGAKMVAGGVMVEIALTWREARERRRCGYGLRIPRTAAEETELQVRRDLERDQECAGVG